MEVHIDVDWAGSLEDRRSTTGYCSFVKGNLETWRIKKQNLIRKSSAEAEFRAIAHGLCEGLWIKTMFEELHITMSH